MEINYVNARTTTCKYHCRYYTGCEQAKNLADQGLDIPCQNFWLNEREETARLIDADRKEI